MAHSHGFNPIMIIVLFHNVQATLIELISLPHDVIKLCNRSPVKLRFKCWYHCLVSNMRMSLAKVV